MNQPELGKKIAELRKAKGLTQEELVSKCNVTVRTLQRIESGLVTPRSYTIKLLFAALDYDINNFSESDPEKSLLTLSKDRFEQFYKCVIDLFNLKTNTMKKISILSVITVVIGSILFLIGSESHAQKLSKNKYLESRGRGIIYMWPKKLPFHISNAKDTADYRIGKSLIQEYNYQIYLNKKLVGRVVEDDTVIFNRGKVSIRKSYWEGNSNVGSGIVYLFPKTSIAKSRSLNRDTTTWVVDDSRIKEYQNKIFLNDNFFGTAESGDTLIFKNGALKFKNVK